MHWYQRERTSQLEADADTMGGDVKPLAFSPTPSNTKITGDIKEPTGCLKRVGNVAPSVCLAFSVYSVSSFYHGFGK